jgi:hypothetical protein
MATRKKASLAIELGRPGTPSALSAPDSSRSRAEDQPTPPGPETVIKQKAEGSYEDNSDFDFLGDLDFSGESPALVFAIPRDILQSLIQGGPGKFIRIEFHEVAKLLMRIVENPDTSDLNREEAKSLLKIAADSSYSTDADREVINHLLASK